MRLSILFALALGLAACEERGVDPYVDTPAERQGQERDDPNQDLFQDANEQGVFDEQGREPGTTNRDFEKPESGALEGQNNEIEVETD